MLHFESVVGLVVCDLRFEKTGHGQSREDNTDKVDQDPGEDLGSYGSVCLAAFE